MEELEELKEKYSKQLVVVKEFLEEKYNENPRQHSFVVSPVMWELIKLMDEVEIFANLEQARVGKYKKAFILLDEYKPDLVIGVVRDYLLTNVNL